LPTTVRLEELVRSESSTARWMPRQLVFELNGVPVAANVFVLYDVPGELDRARRAVRERLGVAGEADGSRPAPAVSP
jgi:hypothetical protein